MNSKIRLEIVKTESQKIVVRDIIEHYHSYVASAVSVGRRIDWLIYHDDFEDKFGISKAIGMIGIGSSVYPPPKDLLNKVGMTKNEYKDSFNSFANNWRFCLTTSIKNAGTQILKQMRERAPIEWKQKYGEDLKYIITFVGAGHNGAVYRADNRDMIGETSGLPDHKSSSMKWNTSEELKQTFVKPTGENKKLIFFKKLT